MAVLGHKVKHRKSSEIRILTKQECRALLRACECRSEVWAVALLLFAGVRPDAEMGEIRRLRWEDVRDSEIYISGSVSKTSADRHIPVLPRLRRLLRGRPAVGAVTPANWRRVWRRLRSALRNPRFGRLLDFHNDGNIPQYKRVSHFFKRLKKKLA